MSVVDAKIAALEQEIRGLKQEKAACADEAEQEWQDVWRYLFDVNGYVRCPAPLLPSPSAQRSSLWHSSLWQYCPSAHRFWHSALRSDFRRAQIVIPGVLSEEECDRANAAIDRQIGSEAYPNIVPGATRGDTAGTESSILGFPGEDSLPFKEMLAHPTIAPYLNTLLGQGWRLDHAPLLLTQGTGSGPGNLHRVGGADASFDPHAYYQHSRDRMYSGLTVVAWQLVDVPEGAGGLCVTAFARMLVLVFLLLRLRLSSVRDRASPSQGRDPRHTQ